MMRNLLCCGWLLVCWAGRLAAAPSGAAPAPPDPPLIDPALALRLAATAAVDTHPDADTVLVADHTRVLYRPDGTSIEWNEEYTKVLTEKGRRGARTRSYGYMTQYGRVHILEAEILRADGTRVPVDLGACSREMVEPSQIGANIYDPNHKVLTLTLPGLEPGDLTRLVVARTTDKARVPNTWSDYAVLEHTAPILWAEYAVLAPAERPLAVLRLRGEIPGKVSYQEERKPEGTWHRWRVQDVPQVFPEPDMPPLHTVVQRLLLSTVADWREISRWYWTLCAPRLAAVNDAMRAEVQRRVADAATRAERIRRLFDFVSREVRYMGITPEEEAPGYEPHDVCMTFGNRYGVCRDKAALLVALLRLADLPAYPVLIHAGARMDPDVPLPFFNHAIVAVEREDAGTLQGAARYELMDPTDENTRDLLPGYLRNKSFLVAHPEGETLLDSGPSPAGEHLVRIRTRGALDAADRLSLDTEIRFEGVNDNAYRGHFARLKPEERRRFFEGLVRARVAGAALESFSLAPDDLRDTGQPLVASLHCAVPDYPLAGKGAWIVDLPWMGGSVGFANWVLGRTGLVKRRFPLDTDPTCGVEEQIVLDLGERFGAPRALPGGVALDSEGLLFRQTTAFTGGVLSAATRFHVRKAEFSPQEYLRLREDRKEMEYASRRRPLFAPPSAADEADVRILRSETRIALDAAGAWTRETRSRSRILTYAGKKAGAEFGVSFNPAWQTAEVLAARVFLPDGTVREAGAQERNLMDAPWVGGAPRYPAARRLVVSLPGVEIGCEIETAVRIVQRDEPFFSLQAALRGEEPCDERVVELSHPAGLALRILEPDSTPALPVQRERLEEAGRVTHRWTVRNAPALRREDDLPPGWVFLPMVMASSGAWDAYGADLAERIARLSREQPAARARALDCIRNRTSERERVRAIRDWVAQSIRPAGPDFTSLPLDALSPADTTLRNGYGHGADRAILLLAMLDAAGLRAEPVLSGAGAPVLPAVLAPLRDCPQRSLFPTLLLRVITGEGETLWINDTDQYAELGTTPQEDRPCMTLSGEHQEIAVAPRFATRGEESWTLEIEEDGTAHIELERRYHGADVNGFRRTYREMPPEERSRHHQELVAGIAQAAEAAGPLVTELDAYPGLRRLAARAPRFAVREEALLQVTLPGLAGNLLGLRSEQRTSPLYRGLDHRSELRHVVRLPARTRQVLLAPPADTTFDLPGGFGTVSSRLTTRRMDDGRLEVLLFRTVDLHSAVADALLYPALLAMNRQLQHPRFATLVVELEDGADRGPAAEGGAP